MFQVWLVDFSGDIWLQAYESVAHHRLALLGANGEVAEASDEQIIRERLWLFTTDDAVHDAYAQIQEQIASMRLHGGLSTSDVESICRHCSIKVCVGVLKCIGGSNG